MAIASASTAITNRYGPPCRTPLSSEKKLSHNVIQDAALYIFIENFNPVKEIWTKIEYLNTIN